MSKSTAKSKLIRNTAAVCFAACILIIGMLASGTYLNNKIFLDRETDGDKTDVGLASTLAQIAYVIEASKYKTEESALEEVELTALSLRDVPAADLMKGDTDDDPNTFIVRTDGDTVIYPDDTEMIPGLTAELLNEGRGTFIAAEEADLEYAAAYSKIRKNYYFVGKYYIDMLSAGLQITAVESAYDGMAVILDSKGRQVYCNEEFGDLDFEGDTGLDEQALNEFIQEYEPYCIMSQLDDKSYTLILAMSESDVVRDSLNIGMLVAILAAIIIGTMIVWIAEIKRLLISRNVRQEERHKYHPAILKRKITTLCILSTVFVFVVSIFAHSMGTLYTVTWDAQNSLAVAEETMGNVNNTTQHTSYLIKQNKTAHASAIADYLSAHPEKRTKNQLKKYSNILSANYLMLYDSEGSEIISDSAYINKHLDNDPKSETYELRKVLDGEKTVYIEDVTDNVTGGKSDLIGVRLPSASGAEGYDMLVISSAPVSETAKPLFSSLDDLLMILVSSYDGYLLLDEDKKIAYMTNHAVYMMDPLELGMKEDQIRSNFMGEFTLDNESLYGLSKGIDGKIVYYYVPSSILYDGAFKFGFGEAAAFIIILAVVFLMMMRGYEKVYEEGPDENAEEYDVVWGGRRGLISRLPFIRNADTPGKRAKAVLNILGGSSILIITVLALSSGGGERRNNLIPYIFSDYWNKGINLFAIARVLILICGVIIAWGIISFLISTMSNLLDTKGVTVVRLVKSILSYVVTLVTAYYAALHLGFDPATLLASVGIIGLAISLGAQDIIKDLFAGLSLVFEKAFSVGDTVEIDGIRGTVTELGARTLRMIGEDNNLKIIRNSDIRKIANLTRRSSVCSIEFAACEADPEVLREALFRELSGIRSRHIDIIRKLELTDTGAPDQDTVRFTVTAECEEPETEAVRSILNYEIRNTLTNYNIRLL